MRSNSWLQFVAAVGFAVLLAAPAAAIDIEEGNSGKGGDGSSCTECPDERPDTETKTPNGGGECDFGTWPDPPPGESQNMDVQLMWDCIQGSYGSAYTIDPIYDGNGYQIGVSLTDPADGDEGEEACAAEDSPDIQWLSLRIQRHGLKAKIAKFTETPAADGTLWVGIGDDAELTMSTSGVGSAAALNTLVYNTVRVRYVATQDDNWIYVTATKPHFAPPSTEFDINQVSLRTTDTGLNQFKIVLEAIQGSALPPCNGIF